MCIGFFETTNVFINTYVYSGTATHQILIAVQKKKLHTAFTSTNPLTHYIQKWSFREMQQRVQKWKRICVSHDCPHILARQSTQTKKLQETAHRPKIEGQSLHDECKKSLFLFSLRIILRKPTTTLKREILNISILKSHYWTSIKLSVPKRALQLPNRASVSHIACKDNISCWLNVPLFKCTHEWSTHTKANSPLT